MEDEAESLSQSALTVDVVDFGGPPCLDGSVVTRERTACLAFFGSIMGL